MIGSGFGGVTAAQLGALYAVGGYYFASPAGSNNTSATLANGNLRLAPLWIPRPMTWSVLGGEVTIVGDAGSTVRLGVYDSDPTTGLPRALLLDAGTIPGDVVAVTDIAINLVFAAAGTYWVGGAVQGVTVTQPTVRVIPTTTQVPIRISGATPTPGQSAMGYLMTGITAALPAAFTGSPGISGVVPRTHFKVAA